MPCRCHRWLVSGDLHELSPLARPNLSCGSEACERIFLDYKARERDEMNARRKPGDLRDCATVPFAAERGVTLEIDEKIRACETDYGTTSRRKSQMQRPHCAGAICHESVAKCTNTGVFVLFKNRSLFFGKCWLRWEELSLNFVLRKQLITPGKHLATTTSAFLRRYEVFLVFIIRRVSSWQEKRHPHWNFTSYA